MPPRRNNPLPAAVRIFNCDLCDKGYPRQIDYENHLNSYDHTHRKRREDAKKLTAANEPESTKPKQSLDMRSINQEAAGKKIGMSGGPRFTKIGGAAAGASRFKKVGVTVGAAKAEPSPEVSKVEEDKPAVPPAQAANDPQPKPSDAQKVEDTVMKDGGDNEEVGSDWEEFDFTKPTGCDHATCPGCRTDGIYGSDWLIGSP